jgi:hypothetical protein
MKYKIDNYVSYIHSIFSAISIIKRGKIINFDSQSKIYLIKDINGCCNQKYSYLFYNKLILKEIIAFYIYKIQLYFIKLFY